MVTVFDISVKKRKKKKEKIQTGSGVKLIICVDYLIFFFLYEENTLKKKKDMQTNNMHLRAVQVIRLC
jgi:hypothetical protein